MTGGPLFPSSGVDDPAIGGGCFQRIDRTGSVEIAQQRRALLVHVAQVVEVRGVAAKAAQQTVHELVLVARREKRVVVYLVADGPHASDSRTGEAERPGAVSRLNEGVAREFQEPLAGEFRRTFDEQNLGLPLDMALQKLAARIPLLDVQFFVSAVLLQKRTGGNLAEVLEKLAFLIRERFKLRGRIRAISAHGRMTGTVLSLIPAAVGVIMFYVNPQYVLFFLHDTTGQWMMGASLALQFAGYCVIKKIVSIEV